MSGVQAGDTAMCVAPSNYGRLCIVERPYSKEPNTWCCTALQTFTLADCSLHADREFRDYPAGTGFSAHTNDLKPWRPGHGTDEALVLAEARDAMPKPVDAAPVRQVEVAR